MDNMSQELAYEDWLIELVKLTADHNNIPLEELKINEEVALEAYESGLTITEAFVEFNQPIFGI